MTGALISAIIEPSQARRTDGAGTYCEMKIRKGVEHMKKVYAAGEVLIDFIAGRKGEADARKRGGVRKQAGRKQRRDYKTRQRHVRKISERNA